MESALAAPLVIFMQILLFYFFSNTARVFPHSGNGSISLISSPPPLRRGASNVKFAPLLFSPLPFLSFFICETYDGIASREIKNGGKGGRNLPPRHSLGKIPLFLLKDVLVRTPFSRKRKRASASAAASTSPHTLCQTRRVKKKKNKMEGGASPVDVVLRGCSRLGKPLLKTRR